MSKILYTVLFLLVVPVVAEIPNVPPIEHYYTLDEYAGLTYNILLEFATTDTLRSSNNIRTHLYSDATKIIFSDALDSGYTKRSVIGRTYYIALRNDSPNVKIIDALRQDIYIYEWWRTLLTWGVVISTGAATALNLFSFGYYINYFKRDRKILEHYRSRSMVFEMPEPQDE